jgi:hypothetical protein
MSAMRVPRWSHDFALFKAEVIGWTVNCAQIADRTPTVPLNSAMSSETEPTQWPKAWTSGFPVTLLTSATARGQSILAMSSMVHGDQAEGRSIPAR